MIFKKMSFRNLFLIFFSGIFVTTFIFTARSQTPRVKTQERPAQIFASAKKAKVCIPNYCRDIVDILNKGGSGRSVLELFDSFYKKIPSTLRHSTRKRRKAQSIESFREQIIEDSLKYQKSLCFCLAMCLLNCVEEGGDPVSGQLRKNVSHNADYSKIWIFVSTINQELYKIKFCVFESDVENVEIGAKISVVLQTGKRPGLEGKVVNVSGGYKTGNFFKGTTNALVPSIMISDPKASALVIKNRLELIFNEIPKNLRVHLEQYAQFIIYGIVSFMGSFLCSSEYVTGEGRADLILRTQRGETLYGSIIELKRGHTAREAIDQILTKEYVNTFDGQVKVVGIAVSGLDKETVDIDCEVQTVEPVLAKLSEETDGYSLQISSSIPKIAAIGEVAREPRQKRRKIVFEEK